MMNILTVLDPNSANAASGKRIIEQDWLTDTNNGEMVHAYMRSQKCKHAGSYKTGLGPIGTTKRT